MNLLFKSELFEILLEKMTGSGYIIEKYLGRKSSKKQ